MITAAGILFKSNDGKALFLKRGPDGDHSGEWNFPGGKLEAGETAEIAAVRETIEEAGACPEGSRSLLARSVSGQGATALPLPGAPTSLVVPAEQVDFTTFLQKIDAPFDVVIDPESTGYAWAPVDDPPQPLHPGAAIALARLAADELGVARMMAAGELASPQGYGNLVLFDIRITGTGVAYRPARNEYVYRDPVNYLTPDFLARCNGLPVIWEHPVGSMLNSQEFADRIIGTVFLPYIKGDEVWAIVKVWDDAAVDLLTNTRFSTSPNVAFFEIDSGRKLTQEDGSTVFVEGPPSLLDHIAICDVGVWDKGGEPAGVNNGNRSDQMAEAEMEADKARKDSDDKLDKLTELMTGMKSCMDSVSARMDSLEEKEKMRSDAARKDAETETKKANEAANEPGAGDDKEVERKAADRARKDSEDKKKDEDEKEKKARGEENRDDAARADAIALSAKAISDLQAKIAAQEAQFAVLTARLAPVSDTDQALLAAAQARADGVFAAFSQRAKRPLDGETPLAYRRRMATELKAHSTQWKGIDLGALGTADAFAIAENQIYADALVASKNPVDLAEGELREVVRFDDTGARKIREFHGQPRAWMSQFSTHPGRLTGFMTKSN